MIQIYLPENTAFEKNGDMVLTPVETTVSAALNGEWTLEMEHPIDAEGRWKYIQDQAVLKVHSFNGEQLFRILSKKKSDVSVTVVAEPIFMDARNDCYLDDVRPTRKNGQEALDILTEANEKYTGKSDITRTSTAYYQNKNLIDALCGNEDNSFLHRWGGEVFFDNYTVTINERIGGDYGVSLLYGKNLVQNGISEEIDFSDVCTRIYPKAYNGYTMSDADYVDSPLVGSYPTVKTRLMKFEDIRMAHDVQEGDEDNVTMCSTQEELNAALKERCEAEFEAGLDKPKVTISANMVLLENTQEYAEYKDLEHVSLGDTIHLRHGKLGIISDARVISLVYDCILGKVTSVVIGDFEENYFNNVSSVVSRVEGAIRPDGSLVAEQVSGFISGAMASLRAQYDVAKRQDVLAILFENLDETSELYGALGIGTQGVMISKERTEDGRGWNWTTALTANGLIADVVVTGLLSDKLGANYWNLDTGEFSLSASATVDGKTVGEIAQEAVDGQTQQYVFDKLTDHGKAQGMFLTDGQLYINASYIHTGEMSADRIKGGTLTLGGTENGNGVLIVNDASGSEIGRWDNNGITATKGNFSGTITATEGTIGGWHITQNSLYRGENALGTAGNGNLYLGDDGVSLSDKFIYNASDGTLNVDSIVATNLTVESGTFSGTLNAATGTFSGELSAATGTFSGELKAATGTFSGNLEAAGGTFSGNLSAAGGTFSGNLDAAGGTFSGELSAATGSFSGSITATEGYIGGTGGFHIGYGKLYSGSHSSYNSYTDGVYIGTDYIALGYGGTTWFADDGSFSLGGGAITFDGYDISLNDVTLSWSDITGKPDVATKSDIPSDAHITEITKNTITTEYINAMNITADSVAAENITGTTISGKTFSGCTAKFETGTIGGWTLATNKIYNTTGAAAVMQVPSGTTGWVFAAGGNSTSDYGTCPFRVRSDGSAFMEKCIIRNALYMYNSSAERNRQVLDVNDDLNRLVIGRGYDEVYSMCSDLTMRPFIGTEADFPAVCVGVNSSNDTFRVYADWSTGMTVRTIATTASDIRLKENIQPTTVEALPIISKINVRQFDWKGTGNHRDIGFVADELEEIDPCFAIGGGYESDGTMNTKSVDTFYMLGYTVKAIQELNEQVEILKSEINQLKLQTV